MTYTPVGEPIPGRWIRRLGTAVLVGVLPVIVWSHWLTEWAPGLRDVVAIDHALTAREIAQGRGMNSGVSTPLHLRLEENLDKAHPIFARPILSLWEAPLFLFRQHPPMEFVVAIAGLWFVPAAWLVFLLASRFHSRISAWICFLVFVLNPKVLDVCTSGRPEALGMFLVCLLFLALSSIRRKPDPGSLLRDPRFLGGLAAGMLMQCIPYLALPLLVLMSLYVAYSARTGAMDSPESAARPPTVLDARAAGRFLAGVLLPMVLVFLGRIVVPGEAPVPVARFILPVNTSVSMGWSFWREFSLSRPDEPFFFTFPAQFAPSLTLKWLAGLSYGFTATFDVFQPVVGGLFLLALFLPEQGEKHGYRWLLLGLVSLQIAAMALMYWDRTNLAIWTPMIILTGIGTCGDFLHARWLRLKKPGDPKRTPGSRRADEARLFYLPLCLLLALTAGSFLLRRFDHLPPARPGPTAAMEHFRGNPEAHDIIVTPSPWLVAWYTGRRTLWMPETERHLELIEEEQGDRLTTVYLPRSRAEILHDVVPLWWYFALRYHSRFPEYELAEFSGYREAVYVRKAAPPGEWGR